MKLSFIVLTIIRFAYGLRDIIPSSPYAISIVLAIGYDRVDIDLGIYQLLTIYHAVREFNNLKPDFIVWLTNVEGKATADEILKENVSTELLQFLDTLPGLFFTDGYYLCSEYGESIELTKRHRATHDFPILKLKAWKLDMYRKVVHYDLDMIPIAPSGFDRMFGVGLEWDQWERKLLGEQDLVGAVQGSPINTGLMLLNPSKKTYHEMCLALKATADSVYHHKAWGNFEKFENPFCDQDLFDSSQSYQGGYFEGGYFKGVWWSKKNWFSEHFPFNKTADRYSDWDFFAEWRDQGFIWYYWVLNKLTRGKVLLTSEWHNKSFVYNPKGDPKCGSYPFISIMQSNIHFMGTDKMQKMGLSPRWLNRVQKTVKEYKMLRFEELKRYHETWMKALKSICCEPEAEDFVDYWWTPKETGCIAYFEFCSCQCS